MIKNATAWTLASVKLVEAFDTVVAHFEPISEAINITPGITQDLTFVRPATKPKWQNQTHDLSVLH